MTSVRWMLTNPSACRHKYVSASISERRSQGAGATA